MLPLSMTLQETLLMAAFCLTWLGLVPGIVWWDPDLRWNDPFLPAEFCVLWIHSPGAILFVPGWAGSFLSLHFTQGRIR